LFFFFQHLEEVLSDGDGDNDNQSASIHSRTHDLLLNRIHTPPLIRSHSPYTISTQASSRNMMNTPSAGQLVDENRYLNDELNRVETVLNLTRAEKDEISIRYNALSDRVSFLLIMWRLFFLPLLKTL
jgi:rootletin